jgi:hypothetical protein
MTAGEIAEAAHSFGEGEFIDAGWYDDLRDLKQET